MCLNCETTPSLPKSTKMQRKKIWELPRRVHCSLIGTCLSLKELRKLSSQAGIILSKKVTDHELHTYFVSAADEKTHVMKLLQKHLDQKYRKTIQRSLKANNDEDFKTLWSEALQSGNVAGAYWAIYTSPLVSQSLLAEVFGEIHMLSHLSGASIRMDIQELKKLRKKIPSIELELSNTKAEFQKRKAEQEKKVRGLNRQLGAMRVETEKLNLLEQKLSEFQQGIAQSRLQTQLKETENQFGKLQNLLGSNGKLAEKWEAIALREQEQNLVLNAQLSELKEERAALEKTVEQMLEPECSSCSHSDHCDENPDLRGRCVMFVGGRYKQSTHFRALVERQNGRFIYHDGGLENSRMQLGKTLSQADIVICPLDCVSHSDMNTVKKHCEKTTKELVLLPHASLSAFTKGLAGITQQ